MNKQFWHRNGSTILTILGGVGVVATSVMAVKATPKALRLIEEAKNEKGEELTKWETVKVASPSYIPSLLMGTTTLVCIFGVNVLNKRSQAALMGAYALLDQTHREYKKKVEELYGEEIDENVRKELAKDEYEEYDRDYNDQYEDGKRLFYDEYSKRYFRATNEAVLRAEYELNKILSEDSYASLNEFYSLVDLPEVDYGDHVGWSSAQMFEMYWSSWINFAHTRAEMEDGMVCHIISFTDPSPNFEAY